MPCPGCHRALGKYSPGRADSIPPAHLVSDVFPQVGQELVEEGQLRDQRLGLLSCRKDKVSPGRDAASRGRGLGQPMPVFLLPGPCRTLSPVAHPMPSAPPHPGVLQAPGALSQALGGGGGGAGGSASTEPQTLPSPSGQGKGEAARDLPRTEASTLVTARREKRRYRMLLAKPSSVTVSSCCSRSERGQRRELPPAWGHRHRERGEHPSVPCAGTFHLHVLQRGAHGATP